MYFAQYCAYSFFLSFCCAASNYIECRKCQSSQVHKKYILDCVTNFSTCKTQPDASVFLKRDSIGVHWAQNTTDDWFASSHAIWEIFLYIIFWIFLIFHETMGYPQKLAIAEFSSYDDICSPKYMLQIGTEIFSLWYFFYFKIDHQWMQAVANFVVFFPKVAISVINRWPSLVHSTYWTTYMHAYSRMLFCDRDSI